MTEAERVAKAERAQAALNEFIAPLLSEFRETYAARIVEIATTELDGRKRSDKITALSTAVRVLDQLETGIEAVIMDGAVAEKDRMRTDRIERMTPSARRLLGLVPGY